MPGGKIVELAVRAVVHGDPVPNVEALANPEALEWFRGVRYWVRLWADPEKVEGLGLVRRGAGEHVGGRCTGDGGSDAVAGQGGEVCEQAPEAVDGQAVGRALRARLGAGGLGGGRVVVVEEHRASARRMCHSTW